MNVIIVTKRCIMNMMENEAKNFIVFAHLLRISKLSYHEKLLLKKKLSIYTEEFHSSWSNLSNLLHYLTYAGPIVREKCF